MNNISNTDKLKRWASKNISPDLDVINVLCSYLNEELSNYKSQNNDIEKYYINDSVDIPKPKGLVYHTKKLVSNMLRKSNMPRFYKKDYHLHHEISELDKITNEKISDEIYRWDKLLGYE